MMDDRDMVRISFADYLELVELIKGREDSEVVKWLGRDVLVGYAKYLVEYLGNQRLPFKPKEE